MAETNNVFISWSGERSRLAAEALKEWLGTVLQNARPWMSTEIEKGSRSYEEIARALEGMKVGIICLTPENLTSEWLHFEAGALSKTLDAKTRVCTYLLADLESATLKPPLAWFQWTKANKADTRKLIGTVNKHLDAAPLAESTLSATFEKWWPDLDEKLKALPAPSGTPPARRGTDEIVAEILEHTRMMIPAIAELSEEANYSRNKREQEAAWLEWVSKQPAGSVIINSSKGLGAGSLGTATYIPFSGKLSEMMSVPGTNETANSPTATQSGETRGHLPSSPSRKRMHAPSRNRRK
jgi:hypothetical protein